MCACIQPTQFPHLPTHTKQLPEVSVDALEVAWPTDADDPADSSGCPTWAELAPTASHKGINSIKKAGGGSSSSSGGCTLPLPVITLAYHDARARPPEAYVAGNVSAPWPLQVGGEVDSWLKEEEQGQNLQRLRDFFDALRSVAFAFAVRSHGWGGGSLQKERETCILVRRRGFGAGGGRVLAWMGVSPDAFLSAWPDLRLTQSHTHPHFPFRPPAQWSLSFLYDLSVGGQFIVSMRHRPLRRCAPLELTDQYIVLCLLIGALALIYEVCGELPQKHKRGRSPPPPLFTDPHQSTHINPHTRTAPPHQVRPRQVSHIPAPVRAPPAHPSNSGCSCALPRILPPPRNLPPARRRRRRPPSPSFAPALPRDDARRQGPGGGGGQRRRRRRWAHGRAARGGGRDGGGGALLRGGPRRGRRGGVGGADVVGQDGDPERVDAGGHGGVRLRAGLRGAGRPRAGRPDGGRRPARAGWAGVAAAVARADSVPGVRPPLLHAGPDDPPRRPAHRPVRGRDRAHVRRLLPAGHHPLRGPHRVLRLAPQDGRHALLRGGA